MKTKPKTNAIDRQPHTLLPQKKRSNATPARILEQVGLENILDMVRMGHSQAEIAEELKISTSTLNRFLGIPANAEQMNAAKKDSAEAWLDRGMHVLEQASGKDQAAVTLARAIAAECARRAAIRNPRYSDRQSVELSGPDGGPVQQASQVIVYVPANGRDPPISGDDE